MTNTPYGNATKSLTDEMKSIVQDANSFANSTYLDMIAVMREDADPGNPVALVTLMNDFFDDRGPHTTLHRLTYHIEVMYMADYSEASFDTLIEYVGEVIDAIEADRGFSNTDIEMIEIMNIDYTHEQEEGFVVRQALIETELVAYRNI